MTKHYKDLAFSCVKDWYCETYPDDNLGKELNSTLSFSVLLRAMLANCDVYKVIGVCDSIVREHIFQKLADICGTDYDFIFGVWLGQEFKDNAIKALTHEQATRVICIINEV
jgi:hypothetical protein